MLGMEKPMGNYKDEKHYNRAPFSLRQRIEMKKNPQRSRLKTHTVKPVIEGHL